VIAETEQELGSATMEVWKGIVSYISEWYQWIKSLIADVWNSLPSFSGPSQPAIPQMATGGLVTGTGLVQVHKDELLVLPRGAEVIPKSHTANVAKAMQGGGDGVSVNITGNIVLSSNMDVDQVGRRLGRAVRREMQLRGVSLG
jgi:hypothetical protein